MTAARGAAVAALVVALVVVGYVLLRGGNTTPYKLRFQNAGQLVKGDDVQIGGRRVGKIKDIVLTDDNQAEVSVDIMGDYAPLHEGTTGTVRQTSLSGIANRYIALDPGPNNARALDGGSVLTSEKTTTPVDLDQLFNTFDPKTRQALANVIQGSAAQLKGRGADANKGARYFNPALSTTRQLVNELTLDQGSLTSFVVDTSKVVTALAARGPTLTDLVSNSNETAGAIAAENTALERALNVLPGTLRKANTTFVNLRSTLDDLDRLVAASKPATKQLAPLLRELRPLVADARPTISDLRQLVRKPGAGNDLTDLLRKAPPLERLAKPTFADTIPALRKTTPVLSFIRPYTPDFTGWLRDFGQSPAAYDANGHYARIQPIFNTFSFSDNVLSVQPDSAKQLGLVTNQLRRCPGAASQPNADGSAPWRDTSGTLDCDPSQVLPGP